MSPENPQKKPTFLIASIAIALFLIGGGIGAFFAINGNSLMPKPIDLDKEIAPDVNAVPKDKPLPPAPKEAVLKQMKYYEIGPNELKLYDANKDGKVAREEFRTLWENHFRNLDRNKDGKLTPQEFRHAAFPGMDLDKNGTLELQEWTRYRYWCFDTFFDADKDGAAIPGEWKK